MDVSAWRGSGRGRGVAEARMKVLCTGGAGFIGSHITDELLRAGHDVVVLDNLSTGSMSNVPARADFYEIDLRDAGAVRDCLKTVKPDAVCHQAAQVSIQRSLRDPDETRTINVLGTANLLEACVAAGTVERFVFASTGGAMYGEVSAGRLASETWDPRPTTPYAWSKLHGERLLLDLYRKPFDLSVTVLRYANV